MKKYRSYLLRCAAAAGLVFLGAGLRWVLFPLLGTSIPYITVFPAVIISAILLGMGPGIFAGLTGIWIMEVWLFPSAGLRSMESVLRMTEIFFSAVFLGYVGGSLRRALIQAKIKADELWLSRERYQALGEAVFDGVLVHDHGRVLDMNETFAKMMNYAPEDLAGKDFIERVVAPEYRGTVLRHMRQNLNNLYELELVRRDGSRLLAEMRDKSITFQGRTVRVVAIQDITERKKHEAALQASRDQLRVALEAARLGTWDYDRKTGRFLCDAYCRALFGTPETAELDYSQIIGMIHPDDQQQVDQVMQQMSGPDTHENYTMEYRTLWPDGSTHWLLAKGQVYYLDISLATHFVGVVMDMTARKQAEEVLEQSRRLLQESEERYRAVLENSLDAAYRRNLRTDRYDYMSPVVRQILGYTSEEMDAMGMTGIMEHVHPDDRAVLQEEISPSEQAGTGRFEYRFRTKAGYYRWLADHVTVTRDVSGQPLYRGGVLRDISARKQAEEALLGANRQLADADRRKDEFMAMLAHELRNPLAPIRNAIQILRMIGPQEGNLKRQRELIDRQVTHMARLLDDLLDVSRITRGKITLKKHPVEVADILGQAMETAQPLMASRNHTLHCSPPPRDLRVEGDPDRLAQVVSNFLTHAAKYTNEGGQIWLSAEHEKGQAVIRVRDNGMGIAPDLLEDVFDLFTQSSRSLDRSQGGLGIGLTIVRNLVEMHSGTVKAFSSGPGQGSEFVVRLPSLAIRPQAESTSALRAETVRPEGACHRVLVVEDVKHRRQPDGFAPALGSRGSDSL